MSFCKGLVCHKAEYTHGLWKGERIIRGTDTLAQRHVRTTAGGFLAAGRYVAHQGQSGGPGGLRSSHTWCFREFGSPVSVETPGAGTGCEAVSSCTILPHQHLPSRQALLPVLWTEVARLRTDARSCRPGVPGRPKRLGKHRGLLHRLQPLQGRSDSRTSGTSIDACSQAADLPPRFENHLGHWGSAGKLAGLSLLAHRAEELTIRPTYFPVHHQL